MKNISIMIIAVLITFTINAQVAHYNQFPSMQPAHILDENIENISFAFSLRILESNYNGPLIKLRRDSDNLEKDFFCNDVDMVDIDAINTWSNGANVFVTIWYDQSGLNRNAIQNTSNLQPKFYPIANNPYFQGDGSDDYLIVDTPNGIQDVTNKGDQATVLLIAKSTTKSQHTFGVLTGRDRWSTHINWSDNNTYFDPGQCCNSIRSFNNISSLDVWKHYSFIKTSTNATVRLNGTIVMDGAHTSGRCTRTEDFTIGWANGNSSTGHSTNSFAELIMYNTNIASEAYQEIEDNAISYWRL